MLKLETHNQFIEVQLGKFATTISLGKIGGDSYNFLTQGEKNTLILIVFFSWVNFRFNS